MYNIPKSYQMIEKKGYTSANSGNYLWLYEMEWIPIERIYVQLDQLMADTRLIKFAHNGRGDSWCWKWEDNINEPLVCYCEAVEEYGIYYARKTSDAIMRQIIEYCASASFYLSCPKYNYQINSEQLKERLAHWQCSLHEVFSERHINTIQQLMSRPIKLQSNKSGKWNAIISQNEMHDLIMECVGFPDIDKKFNI